MKILTIIFTIVLSYANPSYLCTLRLVATSFLNNNTNAQSSNANVGWAFVFLAQTKRLFNDA